MDECQPGYVDSPAERRHDAANNKKNCQPSEHHLAFHDVILLCGLWKGANPFQSFDLIGPDTHQETDTKKPAYREAGLQ